MGDGQHAWAAAEWVMMIRNCFVREESGELVIAAGLKPQWYQDAPARLGPVLTPFGPVTVQVKRTPGGAEVQVEGDWRAIEPLLQIQLPGFTPQESISTGTTTCFQLTSIKE